MRILLMMTCLLTVYGCGGEWSTYPAQSLDELHSKIQTIAVGDSLNIDVFDEPDLSGDFIVLSDGTIQMPLIGAVAVDKLSINDAANQIRDDYILKGYLVDPKILVAISPDSQTIRITGEILNAGEYFYKDGMTVLAVVADAGGFSYRAKQDEFDIIRKGDDGVEQVLKGQISTRIMPGDIIRVRERYF